MGSLMAGWDSPIGDPEQVIMQRNKSMTNEEIEAFWKSKEQLHQQHLDAILLASSSQIKHKEEGEVEGGKLKRSNSVPAPSSENKKRENFMDMDFEADLEKLDKNGWWRRSKWAFLNEPPVTERARNSYVSQFHVATMGSKTSPLGRRVDVA